MSKRLWRELLYWLEEGSKVQLAKCFCSTSWTRRFHWLPVKTTFPSKSSWMMTWFSCRSNVGHSLQSLQRVTIFWSLKSFMANSPVEKWKHATMKILSPGDALQRTTVKRNCSTNLSFLGVVHRNLTVPDRLNSAKCPTEATRIEMCLFKLPRTIGPIWTLPDEKNNTETMKSQPLNHTTTQPHNCFFAQR